LSARSILTPSRFAGGWEGLMIPDMKFLLEIQELDQERIEINDQLRAYPRMWDEIKTRREQCERALQQAQKAQEDFHLSRSRLEQEIKVGHDLLKRYEGQISLMRTQREVSAISSQIDQTKQRVAKVEEELERLVKREETLKEDLETAKSGYKEVTQEAKEERERIRKQIRAKKERLADIEASRKQLEKKVNNPLLAAYDRLLRRWPGSTVVSVRNGSCTGCHFAVLPQKMVEVHRAQAIVNCDNCGRIISHDEDYKPEEQEVASNND
jgi:predicted  nucleic acid-binding Zn-ribbon protein